MTIALIITSVLLGLLFAATGISKAFDTATAIRNAEHLGLNTRLSRAIGVAEIAAALSLFAGIFLTPLAVATAAAVLALMAGAIVYHARARDNLLAIAPALVTSAVAVAIIVLALNR